MKIPVLFLCAAIIIASCSTDRVKISGKITHADKQVLHLDEVDIYGTIPSDSVVLKKDGKFSFAFDLQHAGFYQLRINPDKIIILFPKPGDKVRVNADAGNVLSSLTITGSHDTEQITKLIRMLTKTRSRLDSIASLYEKAMDDSVKANLNRAYAEILESHRRASVAYILTNYNSLSSIYALYQQYEPGYYLFYKTTDLQYFKILSDSLNKYFPGSKHAEALKSYTNKLLADYKANVILKQSKAKMVGLPPVELPGLKGDTIKLSDLKGKLVLLSFWASTNQLSVSENLELKKIYESYRKKGFEIYQVSFDLSRQAWENAIQFDELPWVSVISGPNTPLTGNYNITQIPANYLIAKDNVTIIGKNLSPAQLKSKLQDLL